MILFLTASPFLLCRTRLVLLSLILASFTAASEIPLPADVLELPQPVHQKQRDALSVIPGAAANRIYCSILLQKGKKEQAWLLSLSLEDTGGDATVQSQGSSLFSSTGREFIFGIHKGTLQSSLFGPLPYDGDPACGTNASMSVNRENLRLGLNGLAGFFPALHRILERDPGEGRLNYQWRSEAFPRDPRFSDPVLLEQAGLTAEVERAFVGAIPAMLEFFGIIYETPGLKDLLREMIPARRMLGMLNPFSERSIGFSFGDPVPFLADTSGSGTEWDVLAVIPVELQLNEKTVLQLTLWATDPDGVWETTAGVVFMLVESVPAGKSRMIIRCETGANRQNRKDD